MASSELLKQIQAGKKLKKAETNDRSTPLIDAKPGGGSRGPTAASSIGKASSSPPVPSAGAGGPPQLGSLFSGGVPKLKPAGQSNLGSYRLTWNNCILTILRSSQTSDIGEGTFSAQA